MKKEQLLAELMRQGDELDYRIRNGQEIIQREKENKWRKEVLEAKNEIDKDLWNRWLILLLKRMEFKGIFYGDVVSIGVSGKRPFGNSAHSRDIAETLGWEYEDGLSDKQDLLVSALWEDLPDFINNLIEKL